MEDFENKGQVEKKASGIDAEYDELDQLCQDIKERTKYCFPTALTPILRFFLKSVNAQYVVIFPKDHSTIALTSDMD